MKKEKSNKTTDYTKIYTKQGNRYKPIGLQGTPDLYDGIWVVQFDEYSKSHKNLICRMADLPMPVDVAQLALSTMLEESICSVLGELQDKKECDIYNHSRQDIAEKICNKVYSKLVEKEMKRKI